MKDDKDIVHEAYALALQKLFAVYLDALMTDMKGADARFQRGVKHARIARDRAISLLKET